MPEVACHEPRSALDGGADGFAAWRRLLPALPRLLAPNFVAVLELGAGQAETAAELALRAGLASDLRPDLTGIPRALVAVAGDVMKKTVWQTEAGRLAFTLAGPAAQRLAPGAQALWSGYSPEPVPLD